MIKTNILKNIFENIIRNRSKIKKSSRCKTLFLEETFKDINLP